MVKLRRNINVLVACLKTNLPSTTSFEEKKVEHELFDDECASISKLLSTTDKLIYLVVPLSQSDFVIPLVHNHQYVEQIFIHQDEITEEDTHWMDEYTKIRFNGPSIDEISKRINKEIDFLMDRAIAMV